MITLVRFGLGLMLVLTALFLILLVLIQRGRGGGLAGAFGGSGGQSAFGTKAGDIFTRITVGVAAFWIGLCILSLNLLGQRESLFSGSLGGNAPQAVMPQTQPAASPGGGAAPPPATQPDTSLELSPQVPAGGPSGEATPPADAAPKTDAAPAGEPTPPAPPATEPAK